MPPPRTTSSTSATAAIGARWSAIRRATSSTTAHARRVAGAGGGEDRARVGARLGVVAGRARRPGGADRVDRLAEPGEGEVELAGGAVAAAVELAAEHEPCAHAGADGEEDEVGDAARDALPLLAQRGEVDVVLERDREVERRLELVAETSRPSSPATFSVSCSVPSRGDHAGHADDDAVDQRGVECGRARAARRVGGRSRRSRLRRPRWRARRPGARGSSPSRSHTRAADEARAEVEPEHERGFGHGLEVDGSVAGPVRPALGLAHEPGVEQRLQRERDGRLRDPRAARDLGARDRRACRGSPRARSARSAPGAAAASLGGWRPSRQVTLTHKRA